MKTNINKLFAGMLCAASLFSTTSCIDETFPTDVVTEEQIGSSLKATEALLWAIPAYVNNHATISSDRHWDWGYGSIMHARDVMTGDMAVVASGYDWYSSWAENTAMGEDYIYPQFFWNYYWKFVQTQNNLISAVNPETATEPQLGMLGAAQAYRALAYLDMAQMFEFLPNDKTSNINASGNDVLNLTVPIVREGMNEADARNNPRVHRDVMAAFILEDLDNAEKNIVYLEETTKTLPHLDVVYGLKARLYMWIGDYANAKKYARLAIDNASAGVMTEADCRDTKTGFNQLSKWMLGSQLVPEDATVKTGIINWASWMCNEAQYGYAAAEPVTMLDANMYNRLNNTDFRKKMFKAPAGHELSGQEAYLDAAFAKNFPAYTAIKFRPNEGNYEEYTIGSATAFPLMRVEEMYFIEAEAAEHVAAGEGKALLEAFMTTYRDPEYKFPADMDAVEEIVFHKRVELWGEGLSFYDIKRLNMPVTRGYAGTNFDEARCFNTSGRPAWMNVCIVKTEKNNNKALEGYENPDPSGLYTPWSAE